MFSKAAVLSLLLSTSLTSAHGVRGVPKLFGRKGFVDIDNLPDLNKREPVGWRQPGPERLFKRTASPDGTCGNISNGANNGYTCPGTDGWVCCSQFGFCGDSEDYCGDGCQSGFGKCGNGNVVGGCGPDFGNGVCPDGQCCSGGACGSTVDFCEAPGCQQGFGSCQADAEPPGTNTSTVPRPVLGSVPYGEDIFDCADTPGTIALTFDDGPDIYTDDLLNILASYTGTRVTFFVTANNNGKGEIDITPAWTTVIQKAHANGHQIASHTWSHANQSALTTQGKYTEMVKNEMALRNILGFWPTYMRPPFSECDDSCRAVMKALGYHIIYYDVDTDDYDNDSPLLIQNAKNNFEDAIGPSNPKTDNFLVIAHDIHNQTVHNLTAYMLDTLLAKGYKPVTVGECLGDAEENWYRNATTGGAVPPSGSSTGTGSGTTTTTSPTKTSTSTSSSTSATPNASCAVQVDTWCAPPLASYTLTSDCWDVVATCYDQGNDCYTTVDPNDQTYCDAYDADVCDAQENHCQACADAHGDSLGPCAFLQPTYPPWPLTT